MLLSLFVGTLVGVVAGYVRSLDGILMRITDLFLALPLLPLLLVIIMLFRDTLRSAFGPETGIFILIVFVIGATSWMHTARIVRGDVLAIKSQEFVLAAKSSGMWEYRIILKHILPNVMSSIMVSATLGMPRPSSRNRPCPSWAWVSHRIFRPGDACSMTARTSCRSRHRVSCGRDWPSR